MNTIYRLEDACTKIGIYSMGLLTVLGFSTLAASHAPMPADDGLMCIVEDHRFGWHDWSLARRWMLGYANSDEMLSKLGEAGVVLSIYRASNIIKGRSQCTFDCRHAQHVIDLDPQCLLSHDEPRII